MRSIPMIGGLIEFRDGLRALWAIRRFPPQARRIVFYGEGPADWAHLGPLVDQLADRMATPVLCLTSSSDDPILGDSRPNRSALCIGGGLPMALLLRTLDAGVCVMTMTDLDQYHVQRSIHPVRYVYVFHCLYSTHMIYRERAFDAYDTVFCCGPHHVSEIRARERLFGLKAKSLVEHGYGRLDQILGRRERGPGSGPAPPGKLNVLLASTWGDASIAESPHLDRLIKPILAAGFRLTVRLHPMSLRRNPALPAQIAARFGSAGLTIDTDMRSTESLEYADAMITDWSGAAADFCLGCEKPVLFLETPPKVNNPAFERLPIEPLEMRLRREVGACLSLKELEKAPEVLERLCRDGAAKSGAIRRLRERLVFNPGKSAEIGAAHILDLAAGNVIARAPR